ncbi:HlyD family secretion protein [Methylobacterium sp. JK268]
MSALRRFLVTLCLLAAFVAAAWYGWREWDMRGAVQSTEDAYVRGEITTLSPRVAGYAVAILADDGEAVHAKQVVVRIDPRDFRAAVARAQATLDQARAGLGQAKARLDLQASQIEVAEAALRSAEAQAQNAELTLGRARDLLARGAGTQAAFDQASAAEVTATSAVTQARAQLAYQRRQLGVLQADVTAAEAKVADAQASLDTARLALDDTEVWAPVAGTIANRRTRVGEYVTAGTRMLSIVPREGLWIEANFRETQLARMRPDQPVWIGLDTYGGRRVCGYVEAVGPASGSEFSLVPADNATGNFTKIVRRFPVRIRASANDADRGLLKPGMSTLVRVAVDAPEIDGCRFDPVRDRQLRSVPILPAHPGLAEAGSPQTSSTRTPDRDDRGATSP